MLRMLCKGEDMVTSETASVHPAARESCDHVSRPVATFQPQAPLALTLYPTPQVIVYVEDVNDEPPVFAQQQYSRLGLRETAGIGTSVIVVRASDRDTGEACREPSAQRATLCSSPGYIPTPSLCTGQAGTLGVPWSLPARCPGLRRSAL